MLSRFLAEREGFEPSEPCGSPLFESGQFNHSCTSPTEAIVADFTPDGLHKRESEEGGGNHNDSDNNKRIANRVTL